MAPLSTGGAATLLALFCCGIQDAVVDALEVRWWDNDFVVDVPLELKDSIGYWDKHRVVLHSKLREVCTVYDGGHSCPLVMLSQIDDHMRAFALTPRVGAGRIGDTEDDVDEENDDDGSDLCLGQSPTKARPLVTRVDDLGLGNTIGRWLALATVGRSLGAAVYARFTEPEEGNDTGAWAHGGYDLSLLLRAVQFPCHLRDAREKPLVVDGDPFQVTFEASSSLSWNVKWAGVNDYLPETLWHLLRAQCVTNRGGIRGSARLCDAIAPLPPPQAPESKRAVTRDTFLENYRRAGQSLHPRIDLCNPPPKSYLAVHVRRHDRGAYVNLTDLVASVKRVQGHLTKASSALPWVVVGDSDVGVKEVQRALASLGAELLPRKDCEFTLPGAAPAAALEASSSSSSCEEDGEGGGGGRGQECGSESVDELRDQGRSAAAGARAKNTLLALRDFFLLKGAAGLVASVPGHGESSFSTVAATSGDVPVLFCFKRWRHLSSMPAWYEREANRGEPIRGFYFEEHHLDFARAVVDPHRPRTRRVVVPSCEERGAECVDGLTHVSQMPVPRLPFLPWRWNGFGLVGNDAFEAWLAESPDNPAMARDFAQKVDAEAHRVALPCQVQIRNMVMTTEVHLPYAVNLGSLNTPEELKAAVYRAVVLDNCGAAALTDADFEGVEAEQRDSNYARRLTLALCEAPEFATITAKMMHFVLLEAAAVCPNIAGDYRS